MSIDPLAGYTVGITAARRREELGLALERRGAQIMYGPAIRIVPLVDDAQLREATRRCLAQPLDLAIATTGIGFRGWMDAAAAWGLADELSAALGKATILARGPKVRGAVWASGLRESWSPESENSNEILTHVLANYDLIGTPGRRPAARRAAPRPGRSALCGAAPTSSKYRSTGGRRRPTRRRCVA